MHFFFHFSKQQLIIKLLIVENQTTHSLISYVFRNVRITFICSIVTSFFSEKFFIVIMFHPHSFHWFFHCFQAWVCFWNNWNWVQSGVNWLLYLFWI